MTAAQPGHAVRRRPQRVHARLRQVACPRARAFDLKAILDAGRTAIAHIPQRVAGQHHRLGGGQRSLIGEPGAQQVVFSAQRQQQLHRPVGHAALHDGLERFHHGCDARLAVGAQNRIPFAVHRAAADGGDDPLARQRRVQMGAQQQRLACTRQHGVDIPPIGADRLSDLLPLHRDAQCAQLILHHQAEFSLPQRFTAACDVLKESLQ